MGTNEPEDMNTEERQPQPQQLQTVSEGGDSNFKIANTAGYTLDQIHMAIDSMSLIQAVLQANGQSTAGTWAQLEARMSGLFPRNMSAAVPSQPMASGDSETAKTFEPIYDAAQAQAFYEQVNQRYIASCHCIWPISPYHL